MKKVLKQITAGVAAVSMLVTMSVAAAASVPCKHTNLVKSRINLLNSYNSVHDIYRVVNNDSFKEQCSYHGNIYACSYVCTSCHKIISSTDPEEEQCHRNAYCPQYNHGNYVTIVPN